MFPRVGELRGMELGTPGELRERLSGLVLAGTKTATAGLLAEYRAEQEQLDHVGEREALLGDGGRVLAIVEITRVELVPFAEVTWEFAQAEGEGFTSVEHWARAHRAYWEREGYQVDDDTEVVCLWLRVIGNDGSR
ncbi:hypothetical protein Cs7R123_52090 [Catellatospora sp. TT07R-123]|uniref:ASCH domain-containing protein n=1 Tax=Catellatospora sp. TT07R-123 TaxID=2733863 RepID=UPI001B15F495|nr:ASCH domain-containing protein [Catellatospora sp. TT07R-123]GHJ47867.1 hypothetical protein Cs7R123_52090 [Catellatospora sp. TT07R-123]